DATRRPTARPALVTTTAPDSARRAIRGPRPPAGRARDSARGRRDAAEHGAEFGEGEGLVQERPAEALEEVHRIAADGVAGGEDDAMGDLGVPALEIQVHLPAAEARHAQVAD